MSFQQAANSPGNLIAMGLTVVSDEGVKYNENGKMYKTMQLHDGKVTQKVKVYQGNGQLPPDGRSGQVLNFNVKAREWKGKLYYSGFWNSTATTVTQAMSQTPPQRPQNAPQSTNVPPSAPRPPVTANGHIGYGGTNYVPTPLPRDFDKENRGKCRFGYYQAMIGNGVLPAVLVNDGESLKAIEQLIDWSMNGFPVEPVDEQYGPPDDGSQATDEHGNPLPF